MKLVICNIFKDKISGILDRFIHTFKPLICSSCHYFGVFFWN